jgi:hypothetical protein
MNEVVFQASQEADSGSVAECLTIRGERRGAKPWRLCRQFPQEPLSTHQAA